MDKQAMYKIAYIDEDDVYINRFYHAFKKDFTILKVKVDSDSSVDAIVKTLFENDLDAIITDYLLEEHGNVSFNGNKIVEFVRQQRPYFPIIMLTSYEIQAINNMDDVHIIYSKKIIDGESAEELELFKSKMKSNIDRYYFKISHTKSRIEELSMKKNQQGLNMSEEEELTRLFITLDELEPEGKDMPSSLTRPESISKLHDFVAQTREILKELKKANKK